MGKTIIIGLDGVPFGMIKDFSGNGVMPNTSELISNGAFKPLHSSIPEVSSVAWSSMITGTNPGSHGTYGFMDLHPNTYQMKFPNFNDLKARPFWDEWEGKSVIINVPSTYPVREMNGVLISGFVSIDFEKSVHPKSLVPQLKGLDYRLDVDAQLAHGSMDRFLEDLDKTLDARIEAYRMLWQTIDWQTFMLVFTGTDRLMHFLWNAYEQKDHEYHGYFLEHFRKIDDAVGEILSQISDDDLVIMHSDHGFERLDNDIYIAYVLMDKGYLEFKAGEDVTINNIGSGTKAFVLDPARIYINYKGKYPCGSVDYEEGDAILGELENIFKALEVDGKKVVRDIYRKEQIYSGPYLDDGPEMVLIGTEGFNLKANLKVTQLAGKAIFTGKHTQDTGFLIAKGVSDEAAIPEVPSISDIKGIIEQGRV